jgi:hypothetical protein
MGMAIQAFLLITSFVLREKKNLLQSLVFPLRGFDEWGTLTWTKSPKHPLLRHGGDHWQ